MPSKFLTTVSVGMGAAMRRDAEAAAVTASTGPSPSRRRHSRCPHRTCLTI